MKMRFEFFKNKEMRRNGSGYSGVFLKKIKFGKPDVQ